MSQKKKIKINIDSDEKAKNENAQKPAAGRRAGHRGGCRGNRLRVRYLKTAEV